MSSERSPGSGGTLALAVVAAALVAGGVSAAVVALDDGGGSTPRAVTVPAATVTVTTPAATAGGAESASWSAIARSAVRGVVKLTVRSTVTAETPGGFQGKQTRTALGTGFEIDRSGDIVTNDHVTMGAQKITVHLPDGTAAAGKLVGADPTNDLAVVRIRVAASKLHPLTLGNVRSLELGDPVLAIGTPFGYAGSASAGIVSGFEREIESPNGYTLTDAIQTDAAINHGNSGGPLLDAQGRVVGVNAQLADSGIDGNVGVAFAIPLDAGTRNVIAQLRATGKVSHAWLGISGVTIDRQLAVAAATKTASGVLVTGVSPGSPAAKAGLLAGSQALSLDTGSYCIGGDAITAINGRTIGSMSALQNALDAYPPGTRIRLTVVRSGGKTAKLPLTLTVQPATPPEIKPGCSL
jgi:S1-C subfamily serine protease